LVDGKAKLDTEKSAEKVAVEQDRVPEVKVETKTEARTCLWRPPNRII
jgi:hypothetical protein